MKSILLTPALLILLSACSSQPPQPPVFSESFITSISDDGIKFFTYEATLNLPKGKQRKNKPRGEDRREKTRTGKNTNNNGANRQATIRKMRENTDKAITERLEEHLQKTGYCENGYLILEKDSNAGSGYLRGECK